MGHPGVGKTYLSRKLKEAIPNSYLLDSDEFYAKHGRPYDPDEVDEEEQRIFREGFLRKKVKALEKKLNYGTLLVDGLYKRVSDRKIFYDFAEKYKLKVVIINVICPEGIVVERIKNHKDHVSWSKFRLKGYHRSKKQWEPIQRPHITVNNEKDVDINQILKKVTTSVSQLR